MHIVTEESKEQFETQVISKATKLIAHVS